MKELALHILDITQNSIRAGATEINISVDESPVTDLLTIIIKDNGKGMDEETCMKATDPWFTSRKTRKVGLGLPLLSMNASRAGGRLTLSSSPGTGTTVKATFRYNNIDRLPSGDIPGTIALLITSNPGINIIYNHMFNDNSWGLSTSEVKEALGDTPVTDLKVVRYLKEIIGENISELTNIKVKHDNY